MSDDQLAHLLATRGDTLVDEARLALSSVLKQRDPAKWKAEVNATLEDLERQAEAMRQERQEQNVRQRSLRKGFHFFCLVLSSAGLLLLIFGDNERGAILFASGLIGSALVELRRLVGRFIAAIFSMN